MGDITSQIVQHALTTRYSDLSEAAKNAVRTFLLDTLGVGIAGANAPLTRRVRTAAARWSGQANGCAHFWGDNSEAVAPAQAAFVNGFQIHCQEYDCVHEPAVVHPMATILAALMADVEGSGRPVNGQDFAVALAVAVDLATGIGVSVSSPIKFFRPANAGLFGATLGMSRLRGFDEETTKDALGYALAFCSGTMQAHLEGKPALPVQIANAARGAVMACDMAEAGMAGPHDSLEGPFGYFDLFEDQSDPYLMIDSLGKNWRIAEVSHKPFPTGRACQGGIVLMQKLREQGVQAPQVKHIELTAPPLIHRLVGRPLIPSMTANYARLCFQYCGAVALISGNVGLNDFSDEALERVDIHALGSKMTVIDDASADPAAFVPQIATAKLVDGGIVNVRINTLYGSPVNPITNDAHLVKFRACVDFGMDGAASSVADRLIDLTDTLETLEDVAILSRLAAGLEA